MGYYTDYELTANSFEYEADAKQFNDELGTTTGYNFRTRVNRVPPLYQSLALLQEAKWYDHADDLMKLSTKWPWVTIILVGVGEDRGDHWRMRVRNGVVERQNAVISFPEWTKITD